MRKKCWVLKNQDRETIEYLSEELSLNPLVVNVMLNRGLKSKDEMKAFICPDLCRFHDPYLMKGMDRAVRRIWEAIERKETIAVYGDYDVDGITSVSMLYLALKEMKADVLYFIPDRLKEGYGVNAEAIRRLREQEVSLIITVDCGITANDEVRLGKEIGVDMIITDHHKCPDKIPEALAVLNPKQPDCSYPFQDLAGVGVAFKLVQALLGERPLPELIEQYGALAALGTVADIVPLKDENRIMVYYGIKNMKTDKNAGIQALLQASTLAGKEIDAGTLGFQLAPRINAAGRIGNADMGVRLFISGDAQEAKSIAGILNEQNQIRKEIEQQIFDEAQNRIRADKSILSRNIIILSGKGWHHGVIGIVASRLTEEYYKPCILFAEEGGVRKGSARSIKGFNIYNALAAVSPHIERFGGHELAAGLTVQNETFDAFQQALEAYCKKHVQTEMLIQQVPLDGEIHDCDMTQQLVEELKILEPFGMGNAQPNFLVRKAKIIKKFAFKEGKHLKLSLCQHDKYIDAVGFSMGRYSTVLKNGDQVSLAGNIYINEFRGEKYFSIRIKDIRLS